MLGFYFNTQTQKLSYNLLGSILEQPIPIKVGNELPIRVIFSRNLSPKALTAPVTITLGVKTAVSEEEFVAVCETWTYDAASKSYNGVLDLNTVELIAAIGTDDEINCVVDVRYSDANVGPVSSDTVNFVVERGVVTGDEGTPTHLPTPDEWLSARAVRFDEAQTLTSGEKAQAQSNMGLGNSATRNVGTTAGTVAAGDDSRFSDVPAASLAATIHAATSKATPVDADELPLSDSAASWGLKKLTWANIKATLAGLFASRANNLSDLASASTARTNLGLGTAATANTGDLEGTVPLLSLDGSFVTTGQDAAITTSGGNASIYTTGVGAAIYTQGESAGIYTTGASANIVTLGDDAPIYTGGTNASIYTSGANANLETIGGGYIQTSSTFKITSGSFTTTLSGTQTANRAIAFPDGSGTLAFGSGTNGAIVSADVTDASSGATDESVVNVLAKFGTNGELSASTFYANSLAVQPGGLISFASSNTGGLVVLTGQNATSARSIAFPDASGTLALTSSNVATATALQTSRTIGGTSFNGTANIEIPRARATSSAGGTLENQSSVTCFSWGAGGGQNITIPAGTGVGLNATSYTFGTGAAAAFNAALGLTTLATTTPGTGIATFLATPTSANLAAAVTDETGTGSLVFATSPTISNPTASTSSSSTPALIATGPTSGVDTIQIRGTTTSSYSSIGLMDNSNIQRGSFGYGGSTAGSFSSSVFFNSSSGIPMAFGAGGSEKMRISSAGGLSIGTTTDAGATNLLVAGAARATTLTLGTTLPAATILNVYSSGSSAGNVWRGRMTVGGDTARFLMGEINGQAWLGAHNAALNAWEDFYINPDGAKKVGIGDLGGGSGNVAVPILTVDNANATSTFAGPITLTKTITAAGTTGAQTINKTSGSVNFAAGATSLVVTNSLVSTSSVIMVTMASNDATAAGLRVVAGAGSFTIHLLTAPAAEMRVNFLVTN
jgi:hypothetical protein